MIQSNPIQSNSNKIKTIQIKLKHIRINLYWDEFEWEYFYIFFPIATIKKIEIILTILFNYSLMTYLLKTFVEELKNNDAQLINNFALGKRDDIEMKVFDTHISIKLITTYGYIYMSDLANCNHYKISNQFTLVKILDIIWSIFYNDYSNKISCKNIPEQIESEFKTKSESKIQNYILICYIPTAITIRIRNFSDDSIGIFKSKIIYSNDSDSDSESESEFKLNLINKINEFGHVYIFYKLFE